MLDILYTILGSISSYFSTVPVPVLKVQPLEPPIVLKGLKLVDLTYLPSDPGYKYLKSFIARHGIGVNELDFKKILEYPEGLFHRAIIYNFFIKDLSKSEIWDLGLSINPKFPRNFKMAFTFQNLICLNEEMKTVKTLAEYGRLVHYFGYPRLTPESFPVLKYEHYLSLHFTGSTPTLTRVPYNLEFSEGHMSRSVIRYNGFICYEALQAIKPKIRP